MAISINQEIVILTGAGISKSPALTHFEMLTGSGLRYASRMWPLRRPFAKNPSRVHDFYNARRRQLVTSNVEPNAAHRALAKLEEEWPARGGGTVTIVTQNIDSLHEAGGSKTILHMHGELLKARCLSCQGTSPWSHDLGRGRLVRDVPMPVASAHMSSGLVKCPSLWKKFSGVCSTVLFVSIGTSGNVYPAAGFVQDAARSVRAPLS